MTTAGGLAGQLRLALAGRGHALTELLFEDLDGEPRLGTLALTSLGPTPASSLRLLATEAEHRVTRQGYLPDTFCLLGLGADAFVALVPRDPCPPDGAESALRRFRGW